LTLTVLRGRLDALLCGELVKPCSAWGVPAADGRACKLAWREERAPGACAMLHRAVAPPAGQLPSPQIWPLPRPPRSDVRGGGARNIGRSWAGAPSWSPGAPESPMAVQQRSEARIHPPAPGAACLRLTLCHRLFRSGWRFDSRWRLDKLIFTFSRRMAAPNRGCPGEVSCTGRQPPPHATTIHGHMMPFFVCLRYERETCPVHACHYTHRQAASTQSNGASQAPAACHWHGLWRQRRRGGGAGPVVGSRRPAGRAGLGAGPRAARPRIQALPETAVRAGAARGGWLDLGVPSTRLRLLGGAGFHGRRSPKGACKMG
jgi:hypothetical protein